MDARSARRAPCSDLPARRQTKGSLCFQVRKDGRKRGKRSRCRSTLRSAPAPWTERGLAGILPPRWYCRPVRNKGWGLVIPPYIPYQSIGRIQQGGTVYPDISDI